MTMPDSNRTRANTIFPALTPSNERRRLILISLVIFIVAFGVRLLTWQDARVIEAQKVQSSVSAGYKRVAALLAEGGLTGFLSPS